MAVRKQSNEWLTYLDTSFNTLLASKPIRFAELIPSMIPDVGGVYLITSEQNGQELPYYVGRSKRLVRRIYTSHLMGAVNSARLKRYLISSGECEDVGKAKDFIKEHCSVRWIEIDDIRKRGAIEGYVTGILFPKHGIYEEH